MAKLKPGQRVELEIDRLSYNGGRGVGRHNDLVFFVPFTAPGDLAEVEIVSLKKNFAEAKLIRLIEPSPDRVDTPCKVFGRCGGCQWQHVSSEQQLREKDGFVNYFLRSVISERTEILPILPAKTPYRYRNRIQLHIRGGELGYFEKGSHNLVTIDDCPIADRRITDNFDDLRTSSTETQRLEIALNENGELISYFGKRPPEANLFSQVNSEQNQNLISRVSQLATEISPTRLIELFCGAGNFSFPLAKELPECQISAVELSHQSIWQANKKLEESDINNISFHASDAGRFLSASKEPADLVLLDPPRPGCDNKVIAALLELKPKHIIYISCNLATLARDLQKLRDSYQVVRVEPVDMFPQTDHVEALVLLTAGSPR